MAWQDSRERFFLPADPMEALPDSTIREVTHEEWKRWFNTDPNPVIVNDKVANQLVTTSFAGCHDPETGELMLFITEVFDFDVNISDPNHRQLISNVDTYEQALRNHKLVVISLAAKHGLLPKEGTA